MNYENRIVLFLDILGFKNIIDKTEQKTGAEKEDNEENIQILFDTLKEIYRKTSWRSELPENSRIVTQFSDCIVISFIVGGEDIIMLFDDILTLLADLIEKGILCRGAISYGKLIHTKDVIFGPAMVEAYLTESKAALYPRIILDDTILDFITKDDIPYLDVLFQENVADTYLQKDGDEKYYIDYILKAWVLRDLNDYLNVYLPKLREMIVTGRASSSPDIIVKYGWLKNKFNKAIEDLHNIKSFQDTVHLEQLAQLRLA